MKDPLKVFELLLQRATCIDNDRIPVIIEDVENLSAKVAGVKVIPQLPRFAQASDFEKFVVDTAARLKFERMPVAQAT